MVQGRKPHLERLRLIVRLRAEGWAYEAIGKHLTV
jgi:hypothetical protein